jgi:transcriptional regulator with XRE-family HTH domain
MHLAALIKRRQKELRLSTYQLARDLRISFAAVQRVLDASSRPNVRTIGKYARFLGMSLGKLETRMAPAKPRRARRAKPAARAKSGSGRTRRAKAA